MCVGYFVAQYIAWRNRYVIEFADSPPWFLSCSLGIGNISLWLGCVVDRLGLIMSALVGFSLCCECVCRALLFVWFSLVNYIDSLALILTIIGSIMGCIVINMIVLGLTVK